MDFSKEQKLRNKIDDFCKENNIDIEEAKEMILKSYFISEKEGKTVDETMSEFLHGTKESEEE